MKKIIIITSILILSLNNCANKKSSRKSIFYKGIKKEIKYSRTIIDNNLSKIKFMKTMQGNILKHDFILKNNYNRKLKIKDAFVNCCVHLASYTKDISPGNYGIISINIITDIYGGKRIMDKVTAITDTGKKYIINIEAPVEKFADIKPHKIRLTGAVDSEITGSSIIIPENKYPFNITKIKAKKGRNIKYSFSRIKIKDNITYKINVYNLKKTKGKYRDKLFIETDNSAQKELRIRVSGDVY